MYEEAKMAAETMCLLWELLQPNTLDLDEMMCRLKDLSAYSLEHADIMVRREGVELLALGRFFGIGAGYSKNQAWLGALDPATLAYSGSAENVILQIAKREGKA